MRKTFIVSFIYSRYFLLYPVAEIEVLARKEVFIFIILLAYTFIPSNLKNLYTLIFFNNWYSNMGAFNIFLYLFGLR